MSDQRLAHLEARTNSIHRWVLIIGWIVIIQAILAVGFGAVVGVQAHRATVRVQHRLECVEAGGSLGDCLAAY